ncbi:hypothetical protein GHT06_015128 [Daphnia sinensis]|uniref:Uncharacterized protein n=1 Tax=Daphnia sinensis TaxID=1820382 RepID=A0AAD5LAI3_9CRUS|nr:hypothetical protein GHT06_015128 [Daphnia sinensis]
MGWSGLSWRSVICSAMQLRVWYSFMAYHFPSPVGVAVKLMLVGPVCMLFSPHFLSFTIRRHSSGVISFVSWKYMVSKDPIQKDPVIFFVFVNWWHVHPFQVAAGFWLVIKVYDVGILVECCFSIALLLQFLRYCNHKPWRR